MYEAEQLRVGKRVAVKFMAGDTVGDQRALERFRREVRALSSITSEHVVTVLDSGEVDGETPYLVMERLQGEDLRHLLAREGRLSIYRALRFALDACAGLSAVHEAGLVHRDLKPANVFVTRSKTRGELCKILDFGVAKGHASAATTQNALLGTVRYMAPEQLSDRGAIAATTDVYALGAILFECLTGRPAHDADSPEELMFDILNREPPLATEFRPEMPEALAETIHAAMSRRPSERFQSVGELAGILERFLPEEDADNTAVDQSQVARPSVSFRYVRFRRYSKVLVGAALVSGTVLGYSLSRLGRRDAPDPERSPSVPVARVTGNESQPAPSSAPQPAPEPEKPALTPTANAAVREATRVPTVSTAAREATRQPTAPTVARGATGPASGAPAKQAPAPGVVLDVKNPYEE